MGYAPQKSVAHGHIFNHNNRPSLPKSSFEQCVWFLVFERSWLKEKTYNSIPRLSSQRIRLCSYICMYSSSGRRQGVLPLILRHTHTHTKDHGIRSPRGALFCVRTYQQYCTRVQEHSRHSIYSIYAVYKYILLITTY